MNKKNKILCICTGGTIAMDSETLSSLTLADELLGKVPEARQIADIDLYQLSNFDSVEMKPENWVALAEKIYDEYDNYDGFVVVHGTDTMVYTASAVSFLITNLGKPVIFTGSQIPLSNAFGSDAKNNLLYSFRYASMDIAEVCIFFGNVLLRANRAKKISGTDINAFGSFSIDPLGHAGVRLTLTRECKRRGRYRPLLRKKLLPDVFLLKIYPGINPEVIDKIVEMGYKGIVIESFGIGNIPVGEKSLIPPIKRAIEKGVSIVVASQCEYGFTDDLYPSGRLLKKTGAIMANDMTPESALVKLMWVLGNCETPREISDMMLTPMAGEFSSDDEF